VTIKQDLLPLSGHPWVAFEFGIDDRIVSIFRIQHLGLGTMLLEQGPQEGRPTPTILGVIWPRRDGLEGHEFL
jgi:hypothetical protein